MTLFRKDLSNLNRVISRTIIVDNNSDHFEKHTSNGIHISSWFGDNDDTKLNELTNLLLKLGKNPDMDVRRFLKREQKFIKKHIN